MFRTLVRNTGVTAGAYFAVSIVGIVLVPLLIRAYGVEEFGLLTLARTLLPSAALAVLDFGFSEVATQAVARSRIAQDWVHAGRVVRRLLHLAFGIGLAAALAVGLGAPALARLFNAPVEQLADFSLVLACTGVALVTLFPGMVADGILKGMDAYPALRATEVAAMLSYAIAAVILVDLGFGYASIAYAYLLAQVARVFIVAWYARSLARKVGLRLGAADAAARAFVFERCRLMFVNKLVGAGQTQAPPVLIGLLIGPAAVAVYDVISRLPRFAKSVLGVLNAGLLPVASRLQVSNDQSGMAKLRGGLLLVGFCVVPPLFTFAALSDRVLALWIAPEFGQLGPWTGLLFATTALQTLLSFGGAILMVDADALTRMNRLGLSQLAVCYGIAFAALQLLDERAFVLGQALSVILTVPFYARLMARKANLGLSHFVRLGVVIVAGAAVTALRLVPGTPMESFGLVASLSFLAVACALQWLILYHCALSPDHRRWGRAVLATLAGRSRDRP